MPRKNPTIVALEKERDNLAAERDAILAKIEALDLALTIARGAQRTRKPKATVKPATPAAA